MVDWCEETDFSARITILTGSCTVLECTTVRSVDKCSVTWKSELSRNYYILVGGDFFPCLSTSDVPDNDKCEDVIGPLILDGIPIEGSTALASASADTEAPFCVTATTAMGCGTSSRGMIPSFRLHCATLYRMIHDFPSMY